MIESQELTDRQKQIIDESIKLISEKGLQQFTTKNLAQALKLSEGAIYRHFKNKDSILLSLIKYHNSKSQELFDVFDLYKDKTAINAIELKYLSVMQFFSKNIFFAKIFGNLGVFFYSKYLLNEVSEHQVKSIIHLQVIIERGQKEGNIRNDMESYYIAKIIKGLYTDTIHTWIISGAGNDLVSEWMKMWKVIKKIISADQK